jgi:hypothetical protein
MPVNQQRPHGAAKSSAAAAALHHNNRARYHTARNWNGSSSELSRSSGWCRPARPFSDIILDIEPSPLVNEEDDDDEEDEDFRRSENVRGLKWTPAAGFLSSSSTASPPGRGTGHGRSRESPPGSSTLNLLSDVDVEQTTNPSSPARRKYQPKSGHKAGSSVLGKSHHNHHHLASSSSKKHHHSSASVIKHDGKSHGSHKSSSKPSKMKLTLKYENEVSAPAAAGYRRQASAPTVFQVRLVLTFLTKKLP